MSLAKIINFQGMVKPSLLMAGAIFAILTPFKSAQASTVLLQDNFDSETLGLSSPSLTNWTISDGTVDVIGNPNFFDLRPGNGRYLDLDGSSRNAGKITSKTTFSFNPGDFITLQFDLAGSQRSDSNSVTVSLGSLFSETFTLSSSVPFGTITRTFNPTSATNAQLMFDHAGGDNLGLLLDNVNLSVQPVPEPLTILGAGTAISFGASFKRKLAKKNSKKTQNS